MAGSNPGEISPELTEFLDTPLGNSVLREMGMEGLSEEVLSRLIGDAYDIEVRRTWHEWGPRLARMQEQPVWLFAIHHSSEITCEEPLPQTVGGWMFTSSLAMQLKSSWTRPMVLMPPVTPLCSGCWTEFMRNPDLFLLWPDGQIDNPYGKKLVWD